MTNALVLDGVTKRFGEVVAADSISLDIPKGCIYGFIGPNGAGKTTTIRMVMGIIYPDAGTITVLGEPNSEAVKDRLGYLPEERGLYKKMKTGDMVTYFGRLKGMNAGEAKRKARDLLTRFGLGDWIDKKCETLSKGMGQKVQILGTLIHSPEMVILDEPFSGLDPVNMETMRDLILEMKKEGQTIIFSTHVMEQAEQICDYIFMINKGKKVLDGTLAKIKSAGGQAILLDYDGDGSLLDSLPGIRRVSDSGKQAELFMEEGADPQKILSSLVGKVDIRRFDLREPSLHEIFIRTAGDPSHG
jgi:ABC-2 type transport system ATP-binding protein